MIEAYDLRTLEQLAQFRTVSPVAQVAYNSRGDCVVTLDSSKSETVDYARHVTSHDAGRETLPVDMATKWQVTSHDITSDHMTSHDVT